MAAFWHGAVAASGDPDFGLHCTAASNPGALEIVGYVMLSSRTADEALRRAVRLLRLLNDGLEMTVVREDQSTRCQLTVLTTRDAFLRDEPRQVIESVLFGVVRQLRLLTGREVVPRSVSMRHARPSTGAAEHLRLFRVAPSFGAERDEVVIANEDLEVALRSGNAALLSAFESQRSRRWSCFAMAMSARNLQRKLSAEGTTFQSVLDDALRALAVRHLAAPGATVAKVAWLVGFAEPSAFHRAFRRLTSDTFADLTVLRYQGDWSDRVWRTCSRDGTRTCQEPQRQLVCA
jgi:hypothetical protein